MNKLEELEKKIEDIESYLKVVDGEDYFDCLDCEDEDCCWEDCCDFDNELEDEDFESLLSRLFELEQENEDLKSTIKVMASMLGDKYEK